MNFACAKSANGARAEHRQIIDELEEAVGHLRFQPPVVCVYNPLAYARRAYEAYCFRYGLPPKRILFLGMNPGPWGMVQTGVPFGDPEITAGWLGIREKVGKPECEHPARPVAGFDCARSEISGRRFWGWARQQFSTAEAFFAQCFVANYCPLVFMEKSGANRTPDKLKASERRALERICDRSLRRLVKLLCPSHVVGIGKYAAVRAASALAGADLVVGGITHPSPANPKANSGWEVRINMELEEMGFSPAKRSE